MFSCRVSPDTELRQLQLHDAPQLFALIDRNRAHLRRWLPWVDAIRGIEDEEAFVRRSLGRFAENGAFDCGIFLHGKIVGGIGLHLIDHTNRKAAIGYWLDEAHQGKGLMTQSCRAVVNHLFSDLKLNRAILYCGMENARSRAVAERLGFKLEGIHRQAEWLYDHFIDLACYAMLASD